MQTIFKKVNKVTKNDKKRLKKIKQDNKKDMLDIDTAGIEEVAKAIDDEVSGLIKTAHKTAEKLIKNNKEKVYCEEGWTFTNSIFDAS